MAEFEKILKEMDITLDQLIEMAEHMKDLSQQVIAEKELVAIQKKEQELIDKLIVLDTDYQKASNNFSSEERKDFQEKVERKLTQFQQLNSKFMENISASRGLLYFSLPMSKRNVQVNHKPKG